MSRVLILSMLALWGKSCAATEKYCVHQPRGTESFVGEALTLPCRFVSPKNKEHDSEVTVIWKASNQDYCGGGNKEFYNSLANSTFPQYRRRLVLVGDPKALNATITLANVTADDANTYCCRIKMKHKDGTLTQFQSRKGTHLTVRGENELRIEQPSFIPAFIGDTVNIFSRFTTKNQNIHPNTILCQVRRGVGAGPGCTNIFSRRTCTDGAGKNILHFKIDHVNSSHQGWYCWEIQVLTKDEKIAKYEKNVGTELLIVEQTNHLDIWQPSVTVFNNHAIINCMYSAPQYENILWTRVYWMVGNSREHFIYHPDPDFIHPDYKGKTRLINESILVLEKFHGPDNTTFYCRVVIQRCGLQTEVIMEEGPGTQLRIYSMHDPVLKESSQCLNIIVIYAGIKLLFLLVLFIVALVYIKKT
ncbi:uncharacterized protein LOC142149710 isoform X1 [Mixophyes fleayi]|uniref:uncharacterized protein LOC142149710 isoform X1 n=1 Tax=Mixophyes fleayi TaxID=3061075 RepID=UPI003F4D9181